MKQLSYNSAIALKWLFATEFLVLKSNNKKMKFSIDENTWLTIISRETGKHNGERAFHHIKLSTIMAAIPTLTLNFIKDLM